MIYPEEYITWDLETSGLDPVKSKILEIGMMHMRRGQVVEERTWMLKHEGLEVPQKIIEITGITQEMVDAGVDPKGALAEFVGCLEGVDCMNLTHNGFRFDMGFLYQGLLDMDVLGVFGGNELESFKLRMYNNGFDTAVLFKARELGMDRRFNENFAQYARRVLDTKAYGVKYNVAHCCDRLKIDTSDATFHRALGDVDLTNRIFKALYEARPAR